MERDMSRDKIKISSTRDGHPSGEPFMPIIEFYLDKGGHFKSTLCSIKTPFRSTPNGGMCDLVGMINLDEILKTFEFPENFIIGSPYPNCILDKNHNTTLCFTDAEEYKKYQTLRQNRKIETDARILALRNKSES